MHQLPIDGRTTLKFRHLPNELARHLVTLSAIAEQLSLSDIKLSNIYCELTRLSQEELSSRQAIVLLQQAEEELRDYLGVAKHEEHLVRRWLQEGVRADSNASTIDLQRRKAALVLKAKEYQKALEALTKELLTAPVTLSELSELKQHLRHKEHELAMKRTRIQTYQGLPPNLQLARHELQRARDEHLQLVQLRERLLSNMASGVD
ncbi:hypothetical protein K474DRAFT_1706390 [Panus rudis PR-1116 ss-1]|nr:hypothetical protein K474DRAFT_1706390 [Panus rudis PR-1116 ss-1]